MDKLSGVLEYEKSCLIKKIIADDSEIEEEITKEKAEYQNFVESEDQPEKQFSTQVNLLSYIGKDKAGSKIE